MFGVIIYILYIYITIKTNKVMKQARHATANNTKVGDKLEFIQIPYYVDDMRIYKQIFTVREIKISKTGKRVEVFFTPNTKYVGNIGFNTTFQDITDKFLQELIDDRGIK